MRLIGLSRDFPHSAREPLEIMVRSESTRTNASAADSDDPVFDWARAAAYGDRSAMRSLLEALAPQVARVVKTVLGFRSSEAEDVTQEALLSFARALPSFRHECHPAGFAHRIAARTAIAHRIRQRKHEKPLALLPEEEVELEDPDPNQEERTVAARRLDLVLKLLSELSEVQAETLVLRIMLGCSLSEVAEAMEVPVNTVRSRVRLAKQVLAERLEQMPEWKRALEEDP